MSQKKSDQLGMPFGTAQNRLRKNILFSLLVKHNENICYQCGKYILTVEELSIEHKKPWLDNDTNLFWDIDNIAFSHLFCNVSAAHKIIVADGNKWCNDCKTEHPIVEFGKNSNKEDGLQDRCIASRRIYMRGRYG